MLFPDYGRTFRWFTLLNDGRTFMITVVITGLTNSDTGTNGPHTHADTNLLSESGSNESSECRKYQSVLIFSPPAFSTEAICWSMNLPVGTP